MKKNKKKKVIVGATENAVFKGLCKKSVVCVSRLEPGTTADSVRDHVISNSIDVLSCYDLNNTDSSRACLCATVRSWQGSESWYVAQRGDCSSVFDLGFLRPVTTFNADNTYLRHGYDDAE